MTESSDGRKQRKKSEPLRILWWLDPIVQCFERAQDGKLRLTHRRISGIYHPRTQTIMVCVPEVVFAHVNWIELTVFDLNLTLLHELTHWAHGGMRAHRSWNAFVEGVCEL
jgi:hypothetical protein